MVEEMLVAFNKKIRQLEILGQVQGQWHSFQVNVANACLVKAVSANSQPSMVGVGWAAASPQLASMLNHAFDAFRPTLAAHVNNADMKTLKALLPKVPKVSPQKEVTKVSAEATRSLGLNTIDQGSGKTLDIRERCRAIGLDLGTRVQETVGPQASASALGSALQGVAWQVTGFDDKDQAVMIETGPAQSASAVVKKTVGIEKFLTHFEVAGLETVVHPAWPDKRLFDEQSQDVQNAKADILVALATLQSFANKCAPLNSLVDVFLKPKKALAKKDIGKGALLLVPEVRKLEATRIGKDQPPAGAIEVTFEPPHPSHKFWMIPAVSSDWVAPFWSVLTTSDSDKANLKTEVFNVSMVSAVDYLGDTQMCWPKPAKKARSKVAQPTLEEFMEKETIKKVVRVPVLVNHGAIPASVLLLRFAPDQVHKQKTKQKAITPMHLLKQNIV
jgi:hypothetical protein